MATLSSYIASVLTSNSTNISSSLGSRSEASVEISADYGVVGNGTITAFKGYGILKIETNQAAWVRVYSSQAARTADASRDETEDPAPSAGVIAEVVTSDAETVAMTPVVVGFNDETTPAGEIYLAVENKAIETSSVTVTLTLIQLEA